MCCVGVHWTIHASLMTKWISAVVSFDAGNIWGNLLTVQVNLFGCHQ